MNNRILILDDEEAILEILSQRLSLDGHECVTFTSPTQALDALRGGGFALLVTDLKMPEMSGNEVARRAREIDPDLGVVVVTAMVEVTNAVEALRAGADDYVLKPFDLGEISLSVSRALEKRALVIENRDYQAKLEQRVRAATEDLETTNRELRETKEYLENLIHSTADAIVTASLRGDVEFLNSGGRRMLGYSEEEVTGLKVAEVLAGGPAEAKYLNGMLRHGGPLQNYETEIKHKQGHFVPVSMSVSLVHGANGELKSVLAVTKDITEQKRLEQELKEMSIKDSLTNLYNQRYFYDRLESEIERARRQKHPLSLLLFDIDQFKKYNDCHGHLEGDRVLQTVGKVIMDCTREHVDLGFRYGGDEFVVLLPEAGEEQALLIAERIRKSFEDAHFDDLTVSIGLMAYREGYSTRSFIQFADLKMYDAKRAGGNRVYVFDPEAATQET